MNKPIVFTKILTIAEDGYFEGGEFDDKLYDLSNPKMIKKFIGDDLQLIDIKITPIIDESGLRCLTFLFLYSKIENYENY